MTDIMNVEVTKKTSVSTPAGLERIGRDRMLPKKALHGLAILEKGGEIVRVDDKSYLVQSQYHVNWSNGKWYCNCKNSVKTQMDCEHILGVNYLLRLPQIIISNSSAIQVRKCKRCGSTELGKRGYCKNKSGAVPMLYCKKCGKRMQRDNLASISGANSALALIALDLHFKGVSLRDISDHFYQVFGIKKSPSTIEYWIAKFTRLAIEASKDLRLRVSSKWLADEFFIKEKGITKYIWNVLDFHSRKIIASILLDGRGTSEAVRVLATAIENAGKIPNEIVSDGLASYKNAIQELDLDVVHTANVGIREKDNNNRIERMHNTMRKAADAKRGVKDGTTFAQGFQTYYNHIRPHLGNFGFDDDAMRWIELLSRSKLKDE